MYDATVHHQDLLVEETLCAQFGSAPTLDTISGEGTTDVEVGDGHTARLMVRKLA